MERLELRLRPTQFLSREQDIDSPPGNQTMQIETAVFDNALALAAEVKLPDGRRWRTPGASLKCRHLSRGHVVSLAGHLREVLASTPSTSGLRQPQTAEANLRAFFAIPANRRALQRMLAMFERGGELTAIAG